MSLLIGRRLRPLLAVLLLGLVFLSACADDDDDDVGAGDEPVASSSTTEGASEPDLETGTGRWQPSLADTWQWQLSGELDLSYDVDVYDIDLFDTDSTTIAGLQAEGRRVICYFSAGSWEEWRGDADEISSDALGSTLDGWPDERWLDVTHPSVRAVMAARLDLASAKGCDGVEPDNVDGHDNDTGLSFDRSDQVAYNTWMAGEAHQRGLAVGLKNAVALVPDLVDHYDFAVNEECWAYDECETLEPFISAGKPVFQVEYERGFFPQGCAATAAIGLRSLHLPLDLDDSFRDAC